MLIITKFFALPLHGSPTAQPVIICLRVTLDILFSLNPQVKLHSKCIGSPPWNLHLYTRKLHEKVFPNIYPPSDFLPFLSSTIPLM